MHLQQRQRRINEDESEHLAAAQPEVFDTVGNPLPTSFNRGMSLEAIAAMLGHRSLDMTLRYANPRELHQTGEKLQVAC
jgi:hypothetical protein